VLNIYSQYSKIRHARSLHSQSDVTLPRICYVLLGNTHRLNVVSCWVFTAIEVHLAEYCGKVYDVSEELGFILHCE